MEDEYLDDYVPPSGMEILEERIEDLESEVNSIKKNTVTWLGLFIALIAFVVVLGLILK